MRLVPFFSGVIFVFDELPYTLQPSFVVAYVPSWLKFSYLSELLVRNLHRL